jgi:uncharacterized protein YkwD
MKSFLFALLFCCGAALAQPADLSDDITALSVLELMNGYRAEEGLPPLHIHERLTGAADDRMHHMEEQAYWDHESPDGMSPFTWLRVRDYQFQAAGENLAKGFETAHLLVSSWMESPGHRANIMSRSYDECGIAIIEGSTTGPANGKSIVVMFGKRRSAVMVSRAAQ